MTSLNNNTTGRNRPHKDASEPSSTKPTMNVSSVADYDSVIWSEHPEAAYFRSVMKATGRGDSTIEGFLDDNQTLPSEIKGTGLSMADEDTINQIPYSVGDCASRTGDPRSKPTRHTSTSPHRNMNQDAGGRNRGFRSWFPARKYRSPPSKKHRPATSPTSTVNRNSANGEKNVVYHNLDNGPAGTEDNVPGFIFVAGETAAVQTAPTTSPSNESAHKNDEGRLTCRGKYGTCVIVVILLLAIAVVGAIAIMAVVMTQESSEPSRAVDGGPSTSFEFPPNITSFPTSSPIEDPVSVPPTATQSDLLTAVPSMQQTENPTGHPSPQSSSSPTFQASESIITGIPTSKPSNVPTEMQTVLLTDETTGSPSHAPTAAPSNMISSAPSVQPTADVESLDLYIQLLDSAPESFNALQNQTSPQYKALKWLASDPAYFSYSTERLVQRWASATALFELAPTSSDGRRRHRKISENIWLPTFDNECDWNSLACNAAEQVVTIEIRDEGLSGTIPREISLLTSLQNIILPGNQVFGRLPTELGRLRDLRRLQLTNNVLTGTIPTEFGNFEALLVLGMGRNNLRGQLPSEIGNLPRIQILDVGSNGLESTLPTEIGNLRLLDTAFFDYNQLSGPIPNLNQLSVLRKMKISGNLLTGSLASVCNSTSLELLRADCAEVDCPCCTGCCIDNAGCSGVSFAPTADPILLSATNEPSQQPSGLVDINSSSSSSPSTATPSLSPSAAPTTLSPTIPESFAPSEPPFHLTDSSNPTGSITMTDFPSSALTFRPETNVPTDRIIATQSPTLVPTDLPSTSSTEESIATAEPTDSAAAPEALVGTAIPSSFPTSKPSLQPTLGPTLRPTGRPTPRPTETTTSTPPTSIPTGAPGSTSSFVEKCAPSVMVESTCYSSESSVTVQFVNCEAREDDWLGIYPEDSNMDELPEISSSRWVWLCGNQACQEQVEEGGATIAFTDLPFGEYRLFLARNGNTPPYEGYAESEIVTIQQSCSFFGI